MLPQLYDIFTSCVDIHRQIVPSLEEKASACTMALSHLYYGCVLQAYPGRGEFVVRGRRDFDVFLQIWRESIRTANHTVLDTTVNLCLPEDDSGISWVTFLSEACPDYIPERLSHVLPYHFVTGRVNEVIENLGITVISKLLSSPSSPSIRIVANCTLLACTMVGAQVDRRDIVRIDKSSALPRLMESFLAQFQKALWACNGGELEKDSTEVSRRAWNLLDIICRILELAGHHFSSFHTMRNLDVCKKIYSRARSSEQNNALVLLTALRNVLHFMFAAANVSRNPDELWYAHLMLQGDSHSPEDFDWLVDYLDYIHSDDHEAAYDIFLLLGSMGVCCSPAKQHLFIERLVACMDNNMPPHLRHAALRAAHSAREEMASTDAMDDKLRDVVLTKLSPAILSVLCPHPGTTPANDDPDRFFDYDRDLCYLKLVFALAKNSDWHPHLSGDRHVDRCIGMIPEYCDSESPTQHAFYIAGIFLRITPEKKSVASLDSVTEQQWWDVMRGAWNDPPYDIHNTRDFEFILTLVDGTKKYMQTPSKSDLEKLIRSVDEILERLERRMQWKRQRQEMGPETQGLEQGEGIIIAVKELKTAASNKLESLGQQLLVPQL
ncbi:hypothetical protein DFJ58DRAFT_811747 [Suillus subalutaceus]|uniref:uncharacterized protein n=1 Tax=Suillus subalutaceus TaxID=48586 RepID=UPI001B86F89D|nr:uncharacterized protein DFJ58DRAFT_811747 [Suillus subalutaceus]KAG1839617.1 hypothetical protein DFJ58DRAFT_811747 [Suillus subalutaceus]